MRLRRTRKANQQGAMLVEIAVGLPIFTALLFMTYWIFMAYSWKESITVSVYTAVDLAKTRGNPYSVGLATTSQVTGETAEGLGYASMDALGLIPPLDRFMNGEGWQGEMGSFSEPGLLTSGNMPDYTQFGGSAENAYGYFIASQGWTSLNFADGPPASIPRSALYAMAYAYELLRTNLPTGTKFPCDPNGSIENGDGPGCLYCVPAKPEDLNCEPDNCNDRFGLQCYFKPSNVLLGPIRAILGMEAGSNDLVLSARHYDFADLSNDL